MVDPSLYPIDNLSEDLIARVKPELRADERLIWAGYGNPRPSPRNPHNQVSPLVLPFLSVGALVIGLTLLLCLFGWFGPRFVMQTPNSGEAFAIGFIATALGLLGLIGVAANAWQKRSRGPEEPTLVYALTDRRAIVWKPVKGTRGIEVASYPRGKYAHVRRVEYPDGSGDVLCQHAGEGYEYWGGALFEGVAEVRRVEELVRTFLIVPEAKA